VKRTILTICLWTIRGWMLLCAVAFVVAIYVLFFADPKHFSEDSLTPESPLVSRLQALGFVIALNVFGLFQYVVVKNAIRKIGSPGKNP